MTVSNAPITVRVHAALFDVDGTILNSQGPIHAFWRAYFKDREGIDADYVFETSHGCRTFDVIKKYTPENATTEIVSKLEGQIPDLYGETAKEIPGSIKLVNDIMNLKPTTNTEHQRLAVVTSGTYAMATKWFKLLGLTKPEVFITAESVSNGKPHPEPYLLGRKSLGYEDEKYNVVVFEDAPAGTKSGHDAGCFVIGIASTYDAESVKDFGGDIVVPDLHAVRCTGYDAETDTFALTIDQYTHASERVLAMVQN